jgi:hypothetical protein
MNMWLTLLCCVRYGKHYPAQVPDSTYEQQWAEWHWQIVCRDVWPANLSYRSREHAGRLSWQYCCGTKVGCHDSIVAVSATLKRARECFFFFIYSQVHSHFHTSARQLNWERAFKNHGSTVGIATGYGLDNRVGVRVSVGSRILIYPYCPDRLWGAPSLLFQYVLGGGGGSFPGRKETGVWSSPVACN